MLLSFCRVAIQILVSRAGNPICPYCNKPAQLVSEEEWYGRAYDKLGRPRWVCWTCRASVGTHPDGTPLGSLANQELSKARIDAKRSLEELFPNRKELYAWLSQHMGLPRKEAHVGMFSLEQCKRVVVLCNEEERRRDSN